MSFLPRAHMVATPALAVVVLSIVVFLSFQILDSDAEARPIMATPETHDDRLLRVEQQAPGFGGMFIDRDGTLAIYLLDQSQLPAALAAIDSVFGPQTVPPAGVKVLQGQYTISQLKQWTDLLRDLLTMPGVTTLDLNEATNRVTVGISDSSLIPSVERTLQSQAIPREAVSIDVTGEIRPLGGH